MRVVPRVPQMPRRGHLLPALLAVMLLLLCAVAAAGCSRGEEAERGGSPGNAAREDAAEPANPLSEENPIDEQGAAPATEAAPEADPFGGAQAPSAGAADAAGEATEASLPTVDGEWTGTLTAEDGEEGGLRLTLNQEGRSVSGGAFLSTDRGEITLAPLEGTVDDTGAVELAFDNPTANQSSRLTGTVDGGSMSGEMVLTSTDQSGAEDTDSATLFASRSDDAG